MAVRFARFPLLAAAATALGASAVPVPAAAQGVLIVGDTGGAACYRHARAGRATREALADCSRGILETTSRRDRAATYVNRAIVHINREEYEEALDDVDASFEIRTFGEAYATRGVAMFHLGQMQESIRQATLALEQGDLDEPAKVHYNRALAYERLDMIEEAYFDYLRASEIDPGWRVPKRELQRFTVLPAGDAAAPAS